MTSPGLFQSELWMILGLGFVIGGCLGSFANVLIYRLPRNLSIIHPGSHCPSCRQRVLWFDNLPLISWLSLRGRCRYCGFSIPPGYFLIEAAGAACGMVVAWRFGATWTAVSALLLSVNLLAVARIDWRHMIIPHTLTAGGWAIGLLLAPWNGLGIVPAVLGSVAGAGVILLLSYGYKLVRGQLGMGGGDVMLMGMVGAYLGLRGVLLVLFGGALLGSAFALWKYRGAPARQNQLPFGTFLAAAAGVTLFLGEAIVRWYLGLLA